MSFTKIYKEITMFIFIVVIGCINYTNVYAASDIAFEEFIPINIQKTSDGANVEINTSETNGYELVVKINTRGLEKGYYTTYLYENQSKDWSNYEAISFHVTNYSESPIRINMNFKESDEKVFSPSDESMILVKKDGSEIIGKVKPSYGTVELPKEFEGNIYIPFNSFKEKDDSSKNEGLQISRISSWGIISTLTENEERNFKLSKFALINKGSKLGAYFDSNLYIKGDDIVQIPIEGEAISQYKFDDDNKEVKFKIMNPVDGITISDNGRLTVGKDVEEQNIQICAVLDDTISETKEIKLEKSWMISKYEVDNTSKSIHKSNQIGTFIYSIEKFLLNDNVIFIIRICLILMAIAVGSLYYIWMKNNNKLQ